jgi:hypothetical protein
MPYHMAWRVGWSFFWRRALWLAALVLCIAPLAWMTQRWVGQAYLIALVSAVVAVEAFVIHPLVVQALPRIRYRDFHLAVIRREGPPDDLTYGEALRLSIGPTALLVLFETLGLFRSMLLPLMVAYPAAAWLLIYPWKRCRLEVAETVSPYGQTIS